MLLDDTCGKDFLKGEACKVMSNLASWNACLLLLLTSEEPKVHVYRQIVISFVTECQSGWLGVFGQKMIALEVFKHDNI